MRVKILPVFELTVLNVLFFSINLKMMLNNLKSESNKKLQFPLEKCPLTLLPEYLIQIQNYFWYCNSNVLYYIFYYAILCFLLYIFFFY